MAVDAGRMSLAIRLVHCRFGMRLCAVSARRTAGGCFDARTDARQGDDGKPAVHRGRRANDFILLKLLREPAGHCHALETPGASRFSRRGLALSNSRV